MSILIVTPDRNSAGKNDYTGAFAPEARGFARKHGVPLEQIVRIDLGRPMAARREQLLDAIRAVKTPLETLALFTHGLKRKLPQLGWDVKNVGELAAAINARSNSDPRVIVYACSAADGTGPGGDGGFADALRDALCVAGAVYCQVDAHLHAAHTTKNPYVRRFEGRGSSVGGVGGSWLVAPESPRFRAWRRMLQTEFRFEFPFLDAATIAQRVAAA